VNPLAALILGATAIRLLLAAAIGLGIDESYMVAAGRSFHLGYFDHPPLSWWLSAGAARLFGTEAPVVVRLPFILLFALSTWLMARLAADAYGRRAGFWAALAFNLAPVFGITTGGWVLPDGPLTCALLAAALCLRRALAGRGGGWWLGAGACAGLALLSKYSAALVLAGAFLAIAATPAWRGWLARPHPWLATLAALLVFSPVIAWNAQHGWASFAFQGGRAAAARFQPFGPLVVLAGEAGFLLPWIWLGLAAALVRALRAGPAGPGWLFAWLAIVPIATFCLVALWSRHVLFHWAMPGYLFLFPPLGAFLAGWRPARAWAIGTGAALAVVIAAAASEVRFNWLAAFRPGLDPGLQAVDLAALRPALAARGLLSQPIAAPTWNDAGKIGYALGPGTELLCLNQDARQFGFVSSPAAAIGRDVLIVAPRQDEARIRAAYAGNFDRIEALPPARFALAGRGEAAIPLYLGHTLRHWP
jgi:4-amino-4-deoxy-L-arabinose transferase-like glycosyltransferase